MPLIPIAFYEQRYLINEKGEIFNLATNTFLKPIKNNNGYLKIGLANGKGKSKQASIHRLVAKHFLPNPYGYTCINHIDGNKENNSKTNLEWCSPKQNINHALETGLRPGYMSANDKEMYLHLILNGKQVKDLALEIQRRPETLHKMLRETAKQIGLFKEWKLVMRENRKNAALRNLEKINS